MMMMIMTIQWTSIDQGSKERKSIITWVIIIQPEIKKKDERKEDEKERKRREEKRKDCICSKRRNDGIYAL